MSMQTTKTIETSQAAIDASLDRRPGVPMELDPPRIVGSAHWTEPEKQKNPGYVLKRKGLDELTPVFGTRNPPRGLSGLLRKAAYEVPEHRTTHWLLLLVADRIDVLEHGSGALRAATLPLAAAGAIAMGRIRRGTRRGRRR